MTQEEGIAKVAELMKNVKICMLTTSNAEEQLTSRPMAVQDVEFDGDLWFFSKEDTDKLTEISSQPETNVAFSSGSSWVSLSGKAEQVHDQTKAEELWNPALKAWFPDGPSDPTIT